MGDGKTLKQMADEIENDSAVMTLPSTLDSSEKDEERIRQEMKDGFAYSMTQHRRGRAIIVANSKFTGGKQLFGVEVDVQNLQNIFRFLKFETVVWKNLTLMTLIRHLEDEKRRAEHSDADAFVLCVSSHGTRNKITTSDNKDLDIDKLMTYFDGQMCPWLIGKPKLFIIDACQGGKSTAGVDNPPVVAKDAQPMPPMVHEKNDMSSFYATVPSYVAYDNTLKGSSFIRTLTYVLSRNAHCTDWESMTLQVKNIMKFMVHGVGKHLLAPINVSGFTRKLYLLPRRRLMLTAALSGRNARTLRVFVFEDDTVQTLCEKISAAGADIPADNMYLIHGEASVRELTDRSKTVADYNICHGETLVVVQRREGGGHQVLMDLACRLTKKAEIFHRNIRLPNRQKFTINFVNHRNC